MSKPRADHPLLPRSVQGVQALQAEFAAYQAAAFGPREPAFFSLELCGEAGELANLEKKAWRGTKMTKEAFDEAVAEEAADVLIAVLNYANARQINLARQVADKLATIEHRRQSGMMGGSHHA